MARSWGQGRDSLVERIPETNKRRWKFAEDRREIGTCHHIKWAFDAADWRLVRRVCRAYVQKALLLSRPSHAVLYVNDLHLLFPLTRLQQVPYSLTLNFAESYHQLATVPALRASPDDIPQVELLVRKWQLPGCSPADSDQRNLHQQGNTRILYWWVAAASNSRNSPSGLPCR